MSVGDILSEAHLALQLVCDQPDQTARAAGGSFSARPLTVPVRHLCHLCQDVMCFILLHFPSGDGTKRVILAQNAAPSQTATGVRPLQHLITNKGKVGLLGRPPQAGIRPLYVGRNRPSHIPEYSQGRLAAVLWELGVTTLAVRTDE